MNSFISATDYLKRQSIMMLFVTKPTPCAPLVPQVVIITVFTPLFVLDVCPIQCFLIQ